MTIDIRKQIYQEKQTVERYTDHIRKSRISKRNKQLILDFANFCSALGNSQHRIAIALRHLLMFAERFEGDFDKADRKAIENAIAKLNQSDYSDWTKFTVKKLVKRFYRWVYKIDDGDALPSTVRWIKCPKPPNCLKKEDLVTKEDVANMIASTPQLMYKAILSVLYESAVRPGELLQMKIGDVHFEQSKIFLLIGLPRT